MVVCLFCRLKIMEITEFRPHQFAQTLRYAFVDTPYGTTLAGWCDAGLCYWGFCTGSRGEAVADVQRRFPRSPLREVAAGDCAEVGNLDYASLVQSQRLCLVGTEFRCRVWRELLNIGRGERVSYGDLARRLGIAGLGVRAVGQAVGANPLCIVVPCHRVVASDGSLGGYHWGLSIKCRLLEAENVARFDKNR